MASGAPLATPGAGSALPCWRSRRFSPEAPRGAPARADRDPPDPIGELVALARAGAPLRRALARVAGRMEALRGWERLGFARRRDHAVERLGLSGRQLQELAHMDRVFAELPALERAFVSGRIPWTRARLLARVATPADVEDWIAHAAGVTASELSREVRAVDSRACMLLRETDEDGESERDAKATVFVHCTPAVRARWYRARFLASRLEGRPVPAWMVAERLAAEALSAIPLDEAAQRRIETEQAEERARSTGPEPERSTHLEQGPSNGCANQGERANGSDAEKASKGGNRSDGANGMAAPWRRTQSGPLAPHAPPRTPDAAANGCAEHDPLLASLLEGVDEADAFELDARLRRALAAEQQRSARMGPWLLVVARGRLHRAFGCASLGGFAREWLGISPSKAETLVRLERACESSPPLREACRAGRLSWAQAQLLIPIVKRQGSTPWHAAWVAHAERVSVRRLDDEVAQALALGRLEPPPIDTPRGSWDDGHAAAATEPQTGARPTLFPRTMSFFFTAPSDVARLFRGALATVQRRIERRCARTASESEALDAILEHAFETWQLANAKLQRAHRVFERDDWRCTFPGCTSYGNLHDHHIEYRSQGGSDELSNRTTLCLWHHLRGEHAKVVRCRGRAPRKLRFDLGLRAGRPPLARYRSGDVLVS